MNYIAPVPPLFGGDMNLASWAERREELLALFSREVYGKTPSPDAYQTSFAVTSETEALEGRAICRRVEVTVTTALGSHSFPFALYLPKGKTRVPVILFAAIWGREYLDDQGGPCEKSGSWPVREILGRGYGTAIYFTGEVTPDWDIHSPLSGEEAFNQGIRRIFYPSLSEVPGDGMGIIGAWAFGASRILDSLCQFPQVDSGRVTVIGHSRGGKTALWAAAQDQRFCCGVSNNSGCTGAALIRAEAPKGEQIGIINTYFPYWFCKNYHRYNSCPERLPVDQHQLLALLWPRLLYVTSASEDAWAGPEREYDAMKRAAELYRLEDGAFSLPEALPQPGERIFSGKLGYHLRQGPHALTEWDWAQVLDFLDAH